MIRLPSPADTVEQARERVCDAVLAAGVSKVHLANGLTAVAMLQKAEYLRGKRERPDDAIEYV